MSYTKIVAAGNASAMVRFHYLTEGLFNEVSVLSNYRAKTIKDGTGKSQSDDYAISENERDIFGINLNYAINDIFAEVVKQTKGITNSIFVDATVGDPNAIVGKASGFSVADHGAYNDNNLTLIDNAIRKAIINNILKSWYKYNGLQADMQMAELEYNTALVQINQRMFELKKKLMTE